jgi:hypothetical protein
MKPDVTLVLQDLSVRLSKEIAPEIQPAYHAGTVAWVGMIAGVLADEWDRSAHRLVEENRALRALFDEALAVVRDGGLGERLHRLSHAADEDLHLSALAAANDALRSALIDLHVEVERRTDGPARRIEERIWRELVASTERRRTSLAPF